MGVVVLYGHVKNSPYLILKAPSSLPNRTFPVVDNFLPCATCESSSWIPHITSKSPNFIPSHNFLNIVVLVEPICVTTKTQKEQQLQIDSMMGKANETVLGQQRAILVAKKSPG